MSNEHTITGDDNYQDALHYYYEGELAKAETLCNSIVEACPDNSRVWHLLGMIALQLNNNSAAVQFFNKSIHFQPDTPLYYTTLAEALKRTGKYEIAETQLKKALALKADFPEAINTLGSVYLKQNRLDEAEACFHRCLEIRPEFAASFLNLGTVCQSRGQWHESIALLKKALQLEPGNLSALFYLGCAMQKLGMTDEAINCFQRAINIHPDFPECYLNIAVALYETGDLTGALSSYQRAVSFRPDFPEALNGMGYVYADLGDLEKAKASYNKALNLMPEFYEAWNNLGNVYNTQGRLREAISYYQRSATIRPDYQVAHDNVLFSLHSIPDVSQREIEQAHINWGNSIAVTHPASKQLWRNNPSPDKTLRIGLVSADFYMHPVSIFIIGVLDELDMQEIEIYCYANNNRNDELTKRLISRVSQWRDITSMSDADASKLITDDNIDILVDLSGHTKGNRLLIFARKPAPIQATWLGYPNTTGLEAIDYRITDAIADPVDNTDWHSETLVRLPGGFLCFGSPVESPDVTDPPCLKSNILTFGTFNNSGKICPQAVELWSDILSRVENSRLLLKVDITTLEATKQLLTSRGILEQQIKLIPRVQSYSEHLSLYGEMDIALDVFPYNGTTTTCEAMWMGVPVITIRGNRHVSRVGASLLTRAGFEEFIAESPQDYVEKAVALANDHDKLLKIRHQLRNNMQDSALGDPQIFARQLEQAFRTMWLKWQSEYQQ